MQGLFQGLVAGKAVENEVLFQPLPLVDEGTDSQRGWSVPKVTQVVGIKPGPAPRLHRELPGP